MFRGEQFNFATGEAVGPNHYLENLAELSICDAILTPPSTFSTVAAFLGNTPLVPLYSDVLDDGWTHLNEALLESLQHPEMNTSVK